MIGEITVYPDGHLVCGEKAYRCALGRNGVTEDKREGDGSTPVGTFPLREVFYRSDRMGEPETQLSVRETQAEDGWCTDSTHAEYNSLIVLPHEGEHEELRRDDRIYDIVVPLGYNDSPALPGLGSAIFMHIAREQYSPTDGCVAVSLSDMLEILKNISADAVVTIVRA